MLMANGSAWWILKDEIPKKKLTLSKGIKFAHEGSQDECWLRQIVDQMRPHTAQCDENIRYRQVHLQRKK